jgi:ParB/RepB/Spo0J family partition protein
MSVATLNGTSPPLARLQLVPSYFDTERIVTPDGNPSYTPAMLADLLESIRTHGQLVPGWICPSSELPDSKFLCLEGNRRLAVAKMLGSEFWAFKLPEAVSEAERIRLLFQHHHSRRRMSREEIAERAARYIELTGCTQGEAARQLSVSEPTISRALGEGRIPENLRERASALGLSTRALVAAMPPALMPQAIEYAETSDASGRKPTRDAVSQVIQKLKKGGGPKARKPRTLTQRLNGRVVTFTVTDKDSPAGVVEDLKATVKAIAAKFEKNTDVRPEHWSSLFE